MQSRTPPQTLHLLWDLYHKLAEHPKNKSLILTTHLVPRVLDTGLRVYHTHSYTEGGVAGWINPRAVLDGQLSGGLTTAVAQPWGRLESVSWGEAGQAQWVGEERAGRLSRQGPWKPSPPQDFTGSQRAQAIKHILITVQSLFS